VGDAGAATSAAGTGATPAGGVELLGEKQGTKAPPASPTSGATPPVRPASNDAPAPDTPTPDTPRGGAPAVDVRAELARIARLADPNAFNEPNARQALDAVRALRPQLRTREDSVELDFHAAEANMILGQTAEACRILQPLAARARGGAFARAIDNYLASGVCN
jgi:hypothetical protein